MKKLWACLVAFSCFFLIPAMAVAAETADTEAAWYYTALAGVGIVGALIYGILRIAYGFARPYLLAWAEKMRFKTIYEEIEKAVLSVKQTYTDAVKEASKDGKLTEEAKDKALNMAKARAIELLKLRGIDVLKEFGEGMLNWLIEAMLGKLKLTGAAKAVAIPLDALEPLRSIDMEQAVPEPTTEDFG